MKVIKSVTFDLHRDLFSLRAVSVILQTQHTSVRNIDPPRSKRYEGESVSL